MPMSFKEFMERYEAQGGPLPSAWSPEAQQAYAEKQNMMANAEFRPKNRNEIILNQKLRKLLEPTISEEEKYRLIGELKESNLSEFTPNALSSSGGMTKIPRFLIERIFPQDKAKEIIKNIQNTKAKDIESLGYDAEIAKRHADPFYFNTWEHANEILTRKPPEDVYHVTKKENIPSIAEKGLISPKERGTTGNFGYPEQMDKVFFTSDKDFTKKYLFPAEDTANLRTKTNEEMRPDLHQESAFSSWWQTRKPVPPTALEIESAPGQWEPLIEYLKKRGGK